MLSEAFDELQSSFSAVTSRDSVEIRGLADKHSSDIGRLLDTLKDSVYSAKSELGMAVNGFKSDGLEETQKTGMQVHQEEGRLAVRMGGFKTDTENVKLKALYSFSVVLCIACVMVGARVAKRPARKPADRDVIVDQIVRENSP